MKFMLLELLLVEMTVDLLVRGDDDITVSTEEGAVVVFGVAVVTVLKLGTDSSVCGMNVPVDDARLSGGVGTTSGEDRLHVDGATRLP